MPYASAVLNRRPRSDLRKSGILALWCGLLLVGTPIQAQDPAVWGERETRLANQYMGLLQKSPDASHVVDLLWDLYAEHSSTDLLVDHFAEQAATNPLARLIHGQLLRKGGDWAGARQAFEGVLAADPENAVALEALIAVSIRQNDPAAAIETIRRRSAQLPAQGTATADLHLRLAGLLDQTGARDEAAESYRAAVAAAPEDLEILRRSARGLVQCGHLPEAIDLLDNLAAALTEPGAKLGALRELARLYELDGQVDKAAGTFRAALDSTHFEHHLHEEFFRRLIRLYERESRLDEIEESLVERASSPRPSEADLLNAARFFALTARPKDELTWREKIHHTFPNRADYHRALIDCLIANDAYDEAAASLDALLAQGGAASISLVLLGCEIDAKRGNRTEAAARLEDARQRHAGDRSALESILAFATTHYFDETARAILEAAVTAQPDAQEPTWALVRFLDARGHDEEAEAALARWADSVLAGGGTPPSPEAAAAHARRMRDATALLVSLENFDAARQFGERSPGPQADDPEAHAQLAEIHFEQGRVDQALENLEAAWRLAPDHEARLRYDQRIFSYLQQDQFRSRQDSDDRGLTNRAILPSFPSGVLVPSDTSDASRRSPSQPLPGVGASEAARAFAATAATAAGTSPEPANVWRATWWAFRTDDYVGAYRWLRALDPLAEGAPLEAVRLGLEIARATTNFGLAKRFLLTLAARVPAEATEYRIQLAESEAAPASSAATAVKSGSPDRAIAILEEIIAEEPENFGALEALARAHLADHRPDRAHTVWERAFDRARDPVIRSKILAPLAASLVERGKIPAALDAFTEVIVAERDHERRAQLFAQQLAVANDPRNDASQQPHIRKLAERYRSLQAEHPLDPFYSEALAGLLGALGQKREAFQAMRQAYYHSPDPAPELLENLRSMAAELGDAQSALYFQRQILYTTASGDDPAEWKDLIAMLEAQLDLAGADRSRERLERKFGGDPDILEELLDEYLRTGQKRDALRVAIRLSELRPWNARSSFQLATLQRDNGKPAEAFETFSALADHIGITPTSQAEVTYPLDQLDPAAADLMAEAVERNSFLRQGEKDRIRRYITHHLTRSDGIPVTEPHVRLRAVEEAGKLVRKLDAPQRSGWIARWSEPSLAESDPVAAFRSLHAAGAHAPAAELLTRILAQSEREPAYFDFARLAIASGAGEVLRDWIQGGSLPESILRKRARFAAGAFEAVARTSEAPLQRTALAPLVEESGLFDRAALWTFAEATRQSGRWDDALYLGDLARDPATGRLHPLHAFALSNWARAIHRPAAEVSFLRECFADALPSRQGATWFFGAFERLYALTHDPEEKARLLASAEHAAAHFYTPSEIIRPELLVNALAGRAASPVVPPSPERYASEKMYWQDVMNAELHLDHYQLDEGIDAFAAQVEGTLAAPPMLPGDGDAAELYERFVSEALLHRLRGASPPRRLHLIDQLLAKPFTTQELKSVASKLSDNLFYREATRVLEMLVYAEPENTEISETFLLTARRAQEFAPALSYLHSIFVAHSVPLPERLSPHVLAEDFATFLRLAGDEESLVAYSASAPSLPGQISASAHHELYFLRELATLYQERGEPDMAVDPIRVIAEREPHSRHASLELARALRATDRDGEAAELLSGLDLGSDTPVQIALDVIAELANLRAEAGDAEGIVPLLVSAQKRGRPASVIPVARSAAQAGLTQEALSALELAIRTSDEPAVRFLAAVTALCIFADSPEDADASLAARAFATARDTPSPDEADLDSLVDLLRAQPDSLAEIWDVARTEFPPAAESAVGTLIGGILGEQEGLPAIADRDGASPHLIGHAITELERGGKLDAALALWNHASRRTDLAPRDPHHIRLLAALDDSAGLREVLSFAMREPFPTFRFGTAPAQAFADAGFPDWADALYRKYWADYLRHYRRLSSQQKDFIRLVERQEDFVHLVEKYTTFLVGQGRASEAADRLAEVSDLVPAQAPELIATVIRALPGDPAADLARFHLPTRIQRQTEALLADPPAPLPR
ncbi:hypothetical protein BH23VER1_BH23VER1_05160 [soil metagenome]